MIRYDWFAIECDLAGDAVALIKVAGCQDVIRCNLWAGDGETIKRKADDCLDADVLDAAAERMVMVGTGFLWMTITAVLDFPCASVPAASVESAEELDASQHHTNNAADAIWHAAVAGAASQSEGIGLALDRIWVAVVLVSWIAGGNRENPGRMVGQIIRCDSAGAPTYCVAEAGLPYHIALHVQFLIEVILGIVIHEPRPARLCAAVICRQVLCVLAAGIYIALLCAGGYIFTIANRQYTVSVFIAIIFACIELQALDFGCGGGLFWLL